MYVPYNLQSVQFLNFRQIFPDDSEKGYTFVSVNTKPQYVMYVVLQGAKISMNEVNAYFYFVVFVDCY